MANLNTSEKDDLKRMMDASQGLLLCLYGLRNLEIDCLTESEEFKEIIEHMKGLKQSEASLFSKLSQTDELAKKYLMYLVNDDREKLAISSSLSTVFEDVEDLRNKRIVNMLTSIIEPFMPKGIPFFLQELLKQNLKSASMAHEAVKRDFIKTIFSILNLYLNDEKYADIRKYLIGLKYNLAYLYDEYFIDLLENSFNISPMLYWESGLYKSPKTEFQIAATKEEIALKIITLFVPELLSVDTTKEEGYMQAIIFQIYLRAALLFLSDEQAVDVKKSSIELLDELNATESSKVSEYSSKLLLECFEFRNKDMEIPLSLSLKI